MIGAGPLMVMETRDGGLVELEPVVEAFHVVHGVERDAALADLAEHAVRAAARAVERRAVERGGKALGALVAREVMEALVRVLGGAQAREQARGFLRVAGADGAARRGGGGEGFQGWGGGGAFGALRVAGGGWRVIGVTVRTVAVRAVLGGFFGGGQVHLRVGGVEERELAGQAFLEEEARDGPGLVERREGVAGQGQARGRDAGPGLVARGLPAGFHLRGKFGVSARAADLFGDELGVGIERIGHPAEKGERGGLHGRKGDAAGAGGWFRADDHQCHVSARGANRGGKAEGRRQKRNDE